MKLMVCGGAGFIGSNFARLRRREHGDEVVVLDKLTYAGREENLQDLRDDSSFTFVHGAIEDPLAVATAVAGCDAIVNFAAETHVDRSITGSSAFIDTNIVGTLTLLEAARRHWAQVSGAERERFRFIHVSTDEVYGSLGSAGNFTEDTPYRPNSPYAASKAAADHLVTAWHATYGLPTIITNCSNNYGPYHFPEKLIPLAILNALEGKPIAIYGDGAHVRDWLHVEDHVRALRRILRAGKPGRKYNVGAANECRNVEVIGRICDCLDRLRPKGAPHRRLMTFVAERPGHDRRYAIDAKRLREELGWEPAIAFDTGIETTVRWYLDNEWWWRPLRKTYAGERLGLIDHPA